MPLIVVTGVLITGGVGEVVMVVEILTAGEDVLFVVLELVMELLEFWVVLFLDMK